MHSWFCACCLSSLHAFKPAHMLLCYIVLSMTESFQKVSIERSASKIILIERVFAPVLVWSGLAQYGTTP
uniref:Secreted protein n=1 Tax=Arundo donax TaxID=35708 RepID=A0A0A9F9T5_ARUDO